MNIKITVKLKFYSLSKNWNKEILKAIMNNVIVYELLFSIQTYQKFFKLIKNKSMI